MAAETTRRPVTPVGYAPPSGYRLDVELIRADELRVRVAALRDRGIERVDFHNFLFVTEGVYTHMVDFDTIQCSAGSCVVIQSGQIHEFGSGKPWDGWLLIVRAELLTAHHSAMSTDKPEFFREVHTLPTHIQTDGTAREAITETLERIAFDTSLDAGPAVVNALLRGHFELVLMRLHLAHRGMAPHERVDPTLLQRFRAYRASVEQEFRRWHKVAEYASEIGCSTKTLNRATLAVTDLSAKQYIVDRIVLESKRLLAHTRLTVSTISSELGFDEPTNFVKFFHRETGLTPGAFRRERPVDR